jgi:hypothetical protein
MPRIRSARLEVESREALLPSRAVETIVASSTAISSMRALRKSSGSQLETRLKTTLSRAGIWAASESGTTSFSSAAEAGMERLGAAIDRFAKPTQDRTGEPHGVEPEMPVPDHVSQVDARQRDSRYVAWKRS